MIQINLIPDVKREFLRARKMRDLTISLSVLIAIGSLALVLLVALFLGAQAGLERLADDRIKKEYDSLQSVADLEEMVTIQRQLSLISAQHGKKSMDSRLFSIIQVINPSAPNNVRFTRIVHIPEEGIVRIEGVATGGYPAVDALKKTIENTKVNHKLPEGEALSDVQSMPLATGVVIGETSYGRDSDNRRVLRFELTVTYSENVFTNLIREFELAGPEGRINVTDSKLRVPDSLFTAPARDIDEEVSDGR